MYGTLEGRRIKESNIGLSAPSQWDLISDKQVMQEEQTLQAIGPELAFYNTSKDVGKSSVLSNQLLHAQLDTFCRDWMKVHYKMYS